MEIEAKSTRHFDRLRKGYASIRKSLRLQSATITDTNKLEAIKRQNINLIGESSRGSLKPTYQVKASFCSCRPRLVGLGANGQNNRDLQGATCCCNLVRENETEDLLSLSSLTDEDEPSSTFSIPRLACGQSKMNIVERSELVDGNYRMRSEERGREAENKCKLYLDAGKETQSLWSVQTDKQNRNVSALQGSGQRGENREAKPSTNQAIDGQMEMVTTRKPDQQERAHGHESEQHSTSIRDCSTQGYEDPIHKFQRFKEKRLYERMRNVEESDSLSGQILRNERSCRAGYYRSMRCLTGTVQYNEDMNERFVPSRKVVGRRGRDTRVQSSVFCDDGRYLRESPRDEYGRDEGGHFWSRDNQPMNSITYGRYEVNENRCEPEENIYASPYAQSLTHSGERLDNMSDVNIKFEKTRRTNHDHLRSWTISRHPDAKRNAELLARGAMSQIDLGIYKEKKSFLTKLKGFLTKTNAKADIQDRSNCKNLTNSEYYRFNSGTLRAKSSQNEQRFSGWSSNRKSVNLNCNNFTDEKKSIFDGFLTIGRRTSRRETIIPTIDDKFGVSRVLISNMNIDRRESLGSASSLPSLDSGLSFNNLQNSSSSDENYSALYSTQQDMIRNDNSHRHKKSDPGLEVIGFARAKVDCTPCAYDKEALVFRQGDLIEILEKRPSGTWIGRNIASGQVGHFKFIDVVDLTDNHKEQEKRKDYITKLEIKNTSFEQQQHNNFANANNFNGLRKLSQSMSDVQTQINPCRTLPTRPSKLHELNRSDNHNNEENNQGSLEQLLYAIGLADKKTSSTDDDNDDDEISLNYLQALNKGGIFKLDSLNEIEDPNELEGFGIKNDEHQRRLLMATRIIKQASQSAVRGLLDEQQIRGVNEISSQGSLEAKIDESSEKFCQEPIYVNCQYDNSKSAYDLRLNMSHFFS